LGQEIGALNRGKNAITHPRSQIPGYATDWHGCLHHAYYERQWLWYNLLISWPSC